jgi:hypothetical protein
VDQASEDVAATDIMRADRLAITWQTFRRGQADASVRSLLVVVSHVAPKDSREVPTPQDQGVIEALGSHGSNEALGVGVRWRAARLVWLGGAAARLETSWTGVASTAAKLARSLGH